jgi:hypothetical protein
LSGFGGASGKFEFVGDEHNDGVHYEKDVSRPKKSPQVSFFQSESDCVKQTDAVFIDPASHFAARGAAW